MKNFIKFINEERVARGLSMKTLFEANKLFIFKDGSKWLVESSDQEQVVAVSQDEEEQSQQQFTPDQFESQIDDKATEQAQQEQDIQKAMLFQKMRSLS